MRSFLRQTRVRLALAYAGVFSIVALAAAGALWLALAILVVNQHIAETGRLLAGAAGILLLGMALLVVAATVLGYGLAGTALRPVREIVATARTFSEHDLHQRIDLDLPPDELGELADTFNGMLARLEVSFESLRRFTADAAHELRAPLTLIRTEAEVTLSRPRSEEEYRTTLRTMLAEAERLGRLADQLLMLARVDAGALVPAVAPLDLGRLVAEAVAHWRAVAEQRTLTLQAEVAAGCDVLGDADLLRRLLDNLVDNALRHTPGGGQVSVACAPAGRGLELVVADSGPGVPAALRTAVFDRFARLDSGRGRDTGGAGLGLAICAAIVGLHNGSIAVDDAPGRGARFTVRLPAARARA